LYSNGRSYLGAPAWSSIRFGAHVAENTFLVAPQGQCEEAIRHFFDGRVPIYYGAPQFHLFEGYRDCFFEPTCRYGVLSPAKVYKTPLTDQMFWISTLHMWAPNFESKDTADWHNLTNDGVVNETRYRERVLEITRIMEVCIDHVLEEVNPLRVQVRLPKLGLGHFLKTLTSDAKKRCELIWMETMEAFVSRADHDRLRIVCCSLEPIDPAYPLLHSNAQSDLFSFEKQPDIHVMMINSWDPMSFIGNGGANDRSIDGMVGGGSFNVFWSSAFLSNPLLCPSCKLLTYA